MCRKENETVLLTTIESLKQALANNFNILYRHFHDLLLHFVMQIDAVLGARDIVSEVVPTEVLLQVVQSIEEIGRLPRKVLHD